MAKNTYDYTNFSDCVRRGMDVLNKLAAQFKEDGLAVNVSISSCKWAIEQAINNRSSNETMMTAVSRYIESVENQILNFNGVN